MQTQTIKGQLRSNIESRSNLTLIIFQTQNFKSYEKLIENYDNLGDTYQKLIPTVKTNILPTDQQLN